MSIQTVLKARTFRARAWDAMRILRQFTSADLVTTAEIGADNVKDYLHGLSVHGYIALARPVANGQAGGHALWRLVKNTGPHAPRLHADGFLFDPNTREVLDPKAAGPQAAGGCR